MCSRLCGDLYLILTHTFVFCYFQPFVWGPILDFRSHLCVLLFTAVCVGTYTWFSLTPLCFVIFSHSCGDLYLIFAHTFVFCYFQPFVWGPVVGACFTPFLYVLLIYMETDDSTTSVDQPDTPPATETESAATPELSGEWYAMSCRPLYVRKDNVICIEIKAKNPPSANLVYSWSYI